MTNSTAAITGASSGIGMELARLFAADGHDLIISARRTELLHRLAGELSRAHGIAVHVIPMDLSQPDAGAALWRQISALAPELDVLVNCAGAGNSGNIADQSPESIERLIRLNVSALTSLTRHALPGMIARKRGKILNVSSLAGFQPGGPGMAIYYATKSYVLSFSRSLRRELRGTGVTVTTLCPGPTQTGFAQSAKAQNRRLFTWKTPMQADTVARAGYEAMQRGRSVVVPGWVNKLLAIGAKFSPTAAVLEVNRFLLAERK